MNKRFWISGVTLGVASLVVGFVIHGVLLQGDYARLPNLFRPEAEGTRYLPFMLAAHLMTGFGMTWLYRGRFAAERDVWRIGASFGAGLSLLMTVPTCLIYYAVQPMPGHVVARQIVLAGCGMIMLGVLTARLNRPQSTPGSP